MAVLNPTMSITTAMSPSAIPAGPAPLPRIDDPSAVSPADARALSKTLFQRLGELEEGTPEFSYVRGTLVELNMALVKFVAGRYRTRSEPMEDILQVGTVGLIKAIDRFDPDQGVEFTTFAIPTIAGEIKRFFRDTGWMVHVPRRLQELRIALAKATDELQQLHDRAPTTAELAEHLSLSEAEIREGIVASRAQTAGSLDIGAGSDTDDGPSLGDRIAFEERDYELVLSREALKPAIAALSERDREVLSLRFGSELTQAEIGELLGFSQMHISRVLKRVLGELRTALLAEG
ncbi:SigB/SigF/SigG family RNA polymerase sigma factor [Kitasatospora sp. NPDC088346]|uniref:SigB/SigF/SigG family RNA polymerase sigma factor n=1 Tax=Kitasatospora sp. NPDC088346 TaxID=3364073 RepID=UPI0037F66207